MICCGQLDLYAYNPTEFGLETGNELGTSVGDNGLWGMSKTIHLLDEQLSYASCCDSLVAWYRDCLFSQSVDDDKDLIVPGLVFGEVFEIHAQMLHRSLWDR